MVALAPDQGIRAINEAFQTWTGLEASALIGQRADVVFPRLAIEVPERRRRVEHTYRTETLLETANGNALKADVYGMITPAAAQGEVSHAMVFIDRTASYHAEARTTAQVAAREKALNALQAYTEERYTVLGHLMERLHTHVKEVRPMLFPGREDALTALAATVTQSSRVTAEALSWLRLQRAPLNTAPVDMKAMAQAALRGCAKRYGQVPITSATDDVSTPFALAEMSVVKHVLAWGLEQACRTWKGTPWVLSTWASDTEVGIALQVQGANTMHVSTEAAIGDGRSWALLAVEKMAGHLTVHHGPQGEQGFSLRLPRAHERPAALRNAA